MTETMTTDLSIPPVTVLDSMMTGAAGCTMDLDIPGSPMVTSRVQVFVMLDTIGEWIAVYVDGSLVHTTDWDSFVSTDAYARMLQYALDLHLLDVASL